MKRKTLVIVATGAAVAAAAGLATGVAIAFGANATDRAPEDAGTGVHSTQHPHDVATYWTDERKNNARGG